MIWVEKNRNGEKTVFEKNGSVLKSLKVGEHNTESYTSLVARAKEWFATNSKYCLHKKEVE